MGSIIDAPEYESLFEAPLELDERRLEQRDRESLERAEEAIIGDKDIRLLWRENRMALAKGRPTKVAGGDSAEPGRDYWDVALTCAVQSHPECRFRWSRLIVDLLPTQDGRIRDMDPKRVEGDHPVEIRTTVGAGLAFQTVLKVVEVEPKLEYTKARTLYFPRIVAVGNGLRKGYWDFLALGEEYLHVNKELRLLVSAPTAVPILARFNLQAKVTLTGFAGHIPLLARKEVIDGTYRLA